MKVKESTKTKLLTHPSLVITVISVIVAMFVMEFINISQSVNVNNSFREILNIQQTKKHLTNIEYNIDSVERSVEGLMLTQDEKYKKAYSSFTKNTIKSLEEFNNHLSLLNSDSDKHQFLDKHVRDYVHQSKILMLYNKFNSYDEYKTLVPLYEVRSHIKQQYLKINKKITKKINESQLHLDNLRVSTIMSVALDVILLLFILFVIIKDSQRRIQNDLKLNQIAYIDQLTQLYNRRMVFDNNEHMKLLFKGGEKKYSALIIVDIHNFGNVNDTIGSSLGDVILRQFADRLVEYSQNSDNVARIGGDEFMVYIPNVNEVYIEAESDVQLQATELVKLLSKPIPLPKNINNLDYYNVIPDMGCVVFDDSIDFDMHDLLQKADMALYDAKSNGYRYSVFNKGLEAFINHKVHFEQSVQKVSENGNFELYYQPIIQNDKIVSAEALIRWFDENGELLSTTALVETAEQMRTSRLLGYHVLKKAINTLHNWRVNKLVDDDFSISVNISRSQLNDPNFITVIRELADSKDIPPSLLKLELNEQVMLNDINHNLNKLNELCTLEFHLVLDDFGSGFSSISHLKQLPIKEVKLDRSFIQHITEQQDKSCKVLKAIYELGKSLSKDMTIEGVESNEQYNRLRKIGFDTFQGYFFGKAMNATNLIDYINQFNTKSSDKI